MGGSIQSNKYEVPKNSILFSKLNPHKDKRIWLLQDEVIVNSVCSTEFQVVYPKSEIYLCFLYGWLSFNENYKELASGIGGTSGSHQRIDPKSIFNFPCPLVSDKHIERFNVLVEDIYKKQVINQQQVYNLEKIRNTLLPKLMSGEVKVIIDE